MPLVGNKTEFAVEYTMEAAYPPYGNLRLWVAGTALGDFSEAMHLYHPLSTLKAFTIRKPDTIRTICYSVSDLPTRDIALQHSFLSLGEAHDYYELAIYSITNEQCHRFIWRNHNPVGSPADTDNAVSEATVSWATYDSVVLTATMALETEILDESGRQVTFD